MVRKRKEYAAGETVTFRLRKSDGPIADYLNSMGSPQDIIIQGIYRMMHDDPNYVESIIPSGFLDKIQKHVQDSVNETLRTNLSQQLMPLVESITQTILRQNSLQPVIIETQKVSNQNLDIEKKEETKEETKKETKEATKQNVPDPPTDEEQDEVANALSEITDWI